MLEDVAGGTAFTAGSYNYNWAIQCPGHLTKSYRTGREKEEPVFFFWSQHMIEYYCPDCQQSWWVEQEHDDPPRPL